MRLPESAQREHHWLIDRIAHDFELLDVWALPAEGGPEGFPAFVDVLTSLDPAEASPVSRLLFAVRYQLGRWFGWDDRTVKEPIPGSSEVSLQERLPDELRGSAEGPVLNPAADKSGSSFVPLYRTDREWAAEISNSTVHGVLHLSWPEQAAGRHRAQLAVYVKARGRLGRVYLRLIEPFRHLVVYPALTRQVGRAWQAHLAGQSGR